MQLLFAIYGGRLVVNKNKTTHMRKLLENLAEREGLRHILSTRMKVQGGTRVAFWEWKEQPEQDDSWLLESDEPTPHGCDDPDCFLTDDTPF